jgi:hypothetical protein
MVGQQEFARDFKTVGGFETYLESKGFEKIASYCFLFIKLSVWFSILVFILSSCSFKYLSTSMSCLDES